MQINRKSFALTAALMACLAATACEESKPAPLAPEASTLKPAKSKPAGAMEFAIEASASKVDFAMDAPKEKIRGRVHGSTTGNVQIDPSDITKTTAHLKVDISGIELYQRKVGEDGEFKEEEKVEKQNEHARQWLEISPDVPPDVLKKNSNVEFVIKKVTAESTDVSAMSGDARKVTFSVTGDFLLHGHKTEKTAVMEATFTYKDGKPASVQMKTVKPFAIGLAEHDVRPRESFGKLAQKTLEVLAPKVAKEAQVSLDFTAKFAGMKGEAKAAGDGDTKPASSGDAKPAESGAAKPADSAAAK